METFFKLKERGTNLRTEIMAGVTTFMTMAYVLAVQPSAIVGFGSEPTITDINGVVVSKQAILIMCALISGLITLLMGFYSNFPFALSTGMGVNFLLGSMIQSGEISFGGAMSIILISGILFGLDSALYTIIFQFCQTQVLNLLYRRYDKKTVFIITDKPQEIADRIMEMTHHSATMFKAEGAYTHKPHYVVYSILPSEDVQKVRRYARSIDAHAFINVMKSEGVTGNFYMRPIS